MRWMLPVVLLCACEPSPDFPTPEQPVVGHILAEQSVVAAGVDQQIELLYDQYSGRYRILVVVPADAYPIGTRVTIRLVSNLGPLGDVRYTMNDIVGTTVGRFSAMQILPSGPAPALPLHVALSNVVGREGPLELLHADEGDQGWTTMTTVDFGAETLDFDAALPGLWTLAPQALPPAFKTLLQRMGLTCGRVAVANPLPALLDLSNDSYVWTRVSADGCRTTETGPIGRADSEYCFQLSVHVCVEVTSGGAGLMLYWNGDSSECGPDSYMSEYYVPAPANSLDLLPPVPADCPTVDGGLLDAGRD